MIRRLTIVALLVTGLAVVAAPSPASAAGTCSRNGETLRLVGTRRGVTLDRDGRDLVVTGVDGPSCDGNTITNTRHIVVSAPVSATVRVVVRGGGFDPRCCGSTLIDLRFRGRVVVQRVGRSASFIATAAGIRLDAGRDFEIVGGPWRELVLDGDEGDDVLSGRPRIGGDYPGDLVLRGHGGDDSLLGSAGDDLLYGGPGLDTLTGGLGFDRVWGGDDDDYLHVASGGDELFGGAGTDLVESILGASTFDLPGGTATSPVGTAELHGIEGASGSNGDDTFIGDDGPNLFYGWGGDDHADGAGGDDVLQGGNGGDELVGGIGDDELDGGNQVDSCDAGVDAGDTEVNCELP